MAGIRANLADMLRKLGITEDTPKLHRRAADILSRFVEDPTDLDDLTVLSKHDRQQVVTWLEDNERANRRATKRKKEGN